jgi:hypothetical protein
MKTASVLVSLMLALSATAAPQFGKGFKGQGGGKKGGAGAVAGGAAAGAAGGAAAGAAAASGAPPPVASAVNNGAGNSGTAAGSSAAPPVASAVATGAANATGSTGAGNNNAGNGAAAGGNDPQTSLTLDPAVIAKGFANNGQDVPAAGQVASLTSTNNFINFCLTVPNLPLTDGKQITTGSCNPAPIGVIPSTDNMPSAKFVSPVNNDNFDPNTAFTITMAITNIETGNFVNAQENYFAAPQQVNSGGQIIGHSHVTIDSLASVTDTAPTNPKNFVFFKGINGAAVNGQVTADVDKGLPAGAYRLCSINSSSNHQPVIVPVAQHGSLDDCVYFTVGGAAGGNAGAAAAAAGGNANAGGAATNGTAQAGAGAGAAAGAAAQGGKGGKGGNGN